MKIAGTRHPVSSGDSAQRSTGAQRKTQGASSCALAYQATGNGTYATKALLFVNALLDDYHAIGDGLGGADVVTHDTGYFMRVYAPYTALAYDWLHDAPGMTEALRAKMRSRFASWLGWYDAQGYLRHRVGARLQAVTDASSEDVGNRLAFGRFDALLDHVAA